MNVVELQHPEDLLDKLEAGLIAPAERERLDAHLAGCATCRMELAMRSDFAVEPPLALPELPQLTLAAPEPAPKPASLVPRPGRRRQLSLLVVAAAWCASSALAATAAVSSVKAPWSAWFAHSSAAPAAATASAKATPHHAKNLHAAAAVPTSSAGPESAPSAEVPEALGAPENKRNVAATSRATKERADATASRGDASTSAAAGTAAFALSAENPAAGLLAEADRARRSGDSGRAVALYRELEQTYPSSPESGLSVALVAKLLLDRGDAAGAATAYERYLRGGSAALRAESLVGHARALERLGRTSDAIAAWQEVARSLPGTVHARLAAERLAALSDR